MPKANRTCYCCGRKYYYCPSCPDDRRDPRTYVMWDSESCREIFNVLTNESTKKISTLECKEKLIELGVTKETVLKESVRKHVNRVMSYEEVVKVEEVVSDNISEEIISLEETTQAEEQNEIVVEELDTEIEVKSDSEQKNEIEEVIIEEVIAEPVATIEKTENVKKTKRTKKSSLKNKENSEVD